MRERPGQSLRKPERGQYPRVNLGLVASEGSRSEFNIVDQAIALEVGRFAVPAEASKPVLYGHRVRTADGSNLVLRSQSKRLLLPTVPSLG